MRCRLALFIGLLWGPGLAVASPPALDVRVEPETPAPRPPPRRPEALAVPWVRAEAVVVDGVLDEDAWREVSPAPALTPFISAAAPPEVRLRALLVPGGLALGVDGLAPGVKASVLVNPTGLQARWWRVELGGGTWEVCDYGGLELVDERPLMPYAAGCRPVSEPFATIRNGDAWETVIPWDRTAAPTERARVQLLVTAAGGRGGTWGTWQRDLSPLHGAPLAAGGTGARLMITAMPDQGRFEARLVVPDPSAMHAAAGTWAWRLTYRDLELESGTVAVTERKDSALTGTIAGPLPDRRRLGLVVTAPSGDPFVASAIRWFSVEHRATLSTPVFDDELRVAYRKSSAEEGLEVRVSDGERVLGASRVDVPRGVGVVRIAADPSWPDVITLSIGDRLYEGRALRGMEPD